jgi:dTDP-L-rhamnose 4-epimerase
MNILITGGAGFIGLKLAQTLTRAGESILVLDNLSPQIHGENADWPASLKELPNTTLVRGDINDEGLVKELVSKSDAIVHLAAETGTGQSMYEIRKYSHINVSGSALLLEVASQHRQRIKKFVFASSRSVYGEGSYASVDSALHFPTPRSPNDLRAKLWDHRASDGSPLSAIGTAEQHGIFPASIYAATKYSTELYCRVVADGYGMAIDVLRFQNVYGEGQSLKNPYTGILSIFSNLLRQNKEINIFEDGNESRDFIHVSDVVRAIEISLHAASSGYRVFNVGTGRPTSVLDIANKLKSILKSDSVLRISGDFRVGDIRHCFADTSAAKRLLNFEASVDINEGLDRFAAWVCTQAIVTDDPARAMTELKEKGLAN